MSKENKAPEPWTPAEVRKLRAFAAKRISARVAAAKLGRSPGATRFKAMNEGISFRSIDRQPQQRAAR